MKRGLVIGKFYPPHRGHHYLIDYSASQVDQLVVVVCELQSQTISGDLRAQWLREIHTGVQVIVVRDIGKDDDSEAWANYTKEFLGYIPDAVFTSEAYGDAYARFLGCKHVLVDQDRSKVPISASMIRQRPLDCWEFLEPCVRSYYVVRVCVLGAESTGTTTLARALAQYFQTTWVPEFGRLYSEGKQHSCDFQHWESSEFTFIAEQQNLIEDRLSRTANRLLVCDTDSFATELWHERYLGDLSAEVSSISTGRRIEHYLLTDVDIPFVQDGTRDGEHIRLEMHARFVAELNRTRRPYTLLSGSHAQRMQVAVQICETLLASKGYKRPNH